MILFPHAKINIGLNITRRRPDGYHDLETIFYPIKINDALEVIRADAMSFDASGLGIPGKAEDNLCLKGYQLLAADFDLPPVSIHLHKHIPIGAGLGGGSADAAFFIKAINTELSLGLTAEQMRGYARQLGADCAFFIDGEPTYAFGKGDEFEPVELDLSGYHLVLLMPPAHVSTAEAYRGVKPKPSEASLKDLIKLPVGEWKHHIRNDFEEHIFISHPVIRGLKAALYEAGALYACMSGSGASVFGIFDSRADLSHLEKDNQVFYGV
ncbi:4-(cytidine 5'-diphospho)-2-C-methyl-D-erythritol kinase [Mucilaginibacter myungsuensis]|uniref:4-diphosphocytidyl-2-C-methyl-D-erythritol kinase n=1 Tax=Mucilaginibacter myungsuensis TaxID=649104 RepID=A0A929L1Q6_9SPHI|nr:4-(cytidine 5'-diphospho)-2-C-methyl-D-erythritol kinase [Mucilaginibacter myungsuensis]MBE9662490.1 4-(cytidine 5'-diphospho)-2-C-methyl-D-erythritol kinase [Mucilaginibacter myungsuensis]MDN3597909.1 4-(cytidine 5'-diphospho)-2-C-methyl-D-erythritol kinase [Mucilaginibacter myungsuensis]